jgi:hypothetical protein
MRPLFPSMKASMKGKQTCGIVAKISEKRTMTFELDPPTHMTASFSLDISPFHGTGTFHSWRSECSARLDVRLNNGQDMVLTSSGSIQPG